MMAASAPTNSRMPIVTKMSAKPVMKRSCSSSGEIAMCSAGTEAKGAPDRQSRLDGAQLIGLLGREHACARPRAAATPLGNRPPRSRDATLSTTTLPLV